MKVLLVGEGDFSFSRGLERLSREEKSYALSRDIGDEDIELTATSLDTKEELMQQYPGIQKTLNALGKCAEITHAVNACNLRAYSLLDVIVWNHPHLGCEDVHQHRRLLSHFIFEANRSLSPNGRIVIRQLDGQFERWDVASSITRANLHYTRIPFNPAIVPGYVVKRNRSAKSFTSTEVKKNWVPGGNSSLVSMSSYSIIITRTPLTPTNVITTCPVEPPVSAAFTCDTCHRVFSTDQGLRTHHRQIHQLVLLPCAQPPASPTAAPCSPSQASVESRPRKKARTDEETSVLLEYCVICDEHFVSLQTHLDTFRPAKAETLPCGTCSRSFKDARALNQHARTCSSSSAASPRK